MAKQTAISRDSKGFEAADVSKIKRVKISDLFFDDRNANQGTDLGKQLVKTSIAKYGAGRGILADADLNIIAGNHAVTEMMEQGIEDVIIVPTTGNTLVVTQRTDVKLNSKVGREMAIADNRTTQANLSFDVDLLEELNNEFDLDLSELAINLDDMENVIEEDYTPEENNESSGSGEAEGKIEQTFFPLTVALTRTERNAFDQWKKERSIETDTEAFQLMFKMVQDN